MRKTRVQMHFSIHDVADLCHVTAELITKLIRCGIHPPWHWLPSMRGPRFHPDTLPEWRRILDQIDLDTLPEKPPPLKRPARLFQQHTPPVDEELRTVGKMLGLPDEWIENEIRNAS